MVDKIKAIKKYGRKAKGRASLLKYLQGEKLLEMKLSLLNVMIVWDTMRTEQVIVE